MPPKKKKPKSKKKALPKLGSRKYSQASFRQTLPTINEAVFKDKQRRHTDNFSLGFAMGTLFSALPKNTASQTPRERIRQRNPELDIPEETLPLLVFLSQYPVR